MEILWKKQSAVPEEIGGQEKTEGSRLVIVIRDPNGEVAEIGGPEGKGENSRQRNRLWRP
jgi:hypothetical protein